MIQGMFDRGAMPALERMAQFTGERNKLIANNIANFSTPYYKAVDMDPRAFQAQLRDAIDRRRSTAEARGGRPMGEMDLRSGGPAMTDANGRLTFEPTQTNENILYHDENNRDLDRTMQDLVENTLVHRATIDLMKNQFDMLELAIRGRL